MPMLQTSDLTEGFPLFRCNPKILAPFNDRRDTFLYALRTDDLMATGHPAAAAGRKAMCV